MSRENKHTPGRADDVLVISHFVGIKCDAPATATATATANGKKAPATPSGAARAIGL